MSTCAKWLSVVFGYEYHDLFDILQKDLSQETLFKQYKIVKRETNTSHVQEYGDKVTLTHWCQGDVAVNSNYQWQRSWGYPVQLSSGECHKTALLISQNWLWFDAVMGQFHYKDYLTNIGIPLIKRRVSYGRHSFKMEIPIHDKNVFTLR